VTSARTLARTRPVQAVLELAPSVFSHDLLTSRHAAQTIAEIIKLSPVLLVPALDRAFRDEALHRRLGLHFLDLQPHLLERLERLGPVRNTAFGVASLVRDGYTREVAVQRLAASTDASATAFLINRLNDYVAAIPRLAWDALEQRLAPRNAAVFVRCLPLIDRMSEWVRAGSQQRERLRGLLLAPHPDVRAALWDGARGRDAAVSRSACALLATIHRGCPEMQAIIGLALAARDPRTRHWAASVAVDPDTTPPEVLRAALPLLERDRSPAIRRTALFARAMQGDRDGMVRAAFDTSADVRHHARVLLAGSFGAVDYRGLALASLTEQQPGKAEVLAALATLSDFGRAEDIPRVEAFADDPRRSIAAEARRTLGLLRAL
jgi:hypothetical protein